MPTALLLHAHPDDEVFAAFGWARSLADQGYELIGVLATGGEASELGWASSFDEARRRRLAKYEAVLDLLGARSWCWLDPAVPWVDHPHGPTVSDADPDHLRASVERVVAAHRPDVLLTVGPDGLTGHPDHVAIARAVHDATVPGDVPGGVWGSRLRSEDVAAGYALARSWIPGTPVGSGRVTGTNAPLLTRDVRSIAPLRRQALDIYRPGLGSEPLASLLRGAHRVGDSLLLRAILDATSWAEEHDASVRPGTDDATPSGAEMPLVRSSGGTPITAGGRRDRNPPP